MPELKEQAAQGSECLMQSLRRVLREGIAAVRALENTVTFREAAEESLMRRAERRPTTRRDLRCFINRMLRVPGFGERPLRAITTRECHQMLDTAFAGSAHSFRKGRAILHSIFAYGKRQQWCGENPVAAIDIPRVEEREIRPLSLPECRRLLETARRPAFRDCLPALGLMLFAGVRPGEVERLHWSDLRCREGFLSLRSHHSKTGGARRVELCPPLRRLLRTHPVTVAATKQHPLCPPRWRKRWHQLRQAAGLATSQNRWVPDVLRHTFASYHALTHRNLPALQLQLGHRDARLLYARYLNLPGLRQTDATHFWHLA